MRVHWEIPESPSSVDASELQEGTVCFRLAYFDADLSVPSVEPVVYIGRNLEPGDEAVVYFQDCASYGKGVRFGALTLGVGAAIFESFDADGGTNILHFEQAVDELLRCAIRRRGGRPANPDCEN